MAVTTLADMKVYLGISTGTTGDDALIETLITQAQGWLERVCKRSFDTSSGVRYYREDDLRVLPEGSQWRPVGSSKAARYSWDAWPDSSLSAGQYGHTVLWLGKDLATITSLTNGNSSTISSTGYWLEPRNDPPYQYIRLKSNASWQFNTDGEIAVDGFWGYSTTPPGPIVWAVKDLVAYCYRHRDSSVFQVMQSPDGGIIQVPEGWPQTVKKVVESGYVRAIRIV